MNNMTIKAHLTLAAIALFALPSVANAQNMFMDRRTQGTMIEDITAAHVGDLLSILISETQRIKNEDKVERSNTSSLEARLNAYTLGQDTFNENVLPRFDISQNREFEGGAKQEKDTTFEASISVMIIDVLPNGNLVIAGSRIIEVDDEIKTLRISGLVRRLDVTAANTVTSAQVADARLSITGEGANTRVNTRGPIASLWDTLIWAVWPF
jgi:flagellar L-ring protein precursor FlgH